MLDLKSNQLYKQSLAPLPSYTADFVLISSRLLSSYLENGSESADEAETYKSYMDDLVQALNGTSMQSKKTSRLVFEKIEAYSKGHRPIY
ncbi:hypothetical protein [Paenibacillus physcomitrellae]|nr:hypothetical protein [Paenibacillus physcomitrellae]